MIYINSRRLLKYQYLEGRMTMIVFPVLLLTLLSPSEACFKPPPVCPNDKQSCIADNNDNVLQIKEVSNPLKCSKYKLECFIKVAVLCTAYD